MIPEKATLTRLRLIAITDAPTFGWAATERAALSALAAGLPALMLRERALSDEALLPIALRLKRQAEASGGLLIVNRRLDLAERVGADGVHLGAQGPTVAEARRRLGEGSLIGYSAHEEREALAALEAGADYVTFSPVYATPSKAGILEPVGLERLAALAARAPGRVVALGGINKTNLGDVMHAGAIGAALIRGVFGAEDPAAATRGLLDAISLATSNRT